MPNQTEQARPRTVLMLHAYPLSGAMWETQQRALEAAGLKVIVPHLPGFGGMEGQMAGLPETARDLLVLLPDEPVSVVGLSMGGYLALELLAQAPERFGRVVLADTSARADTPDKVKDRLSQAVRVRQEGRGFILEAAEKEYSASTYKKVLPMMEAATPEGIAAALEAMAARPAHLDVLEQLKVPLLVLVGEQDETTPPELAREIAQAGRGELLTIPEAGHLSNLDNPQAFNGALVKFLV